jgi:HAD superfamily hydrolase (TIGR01509 family)
MHTAGESVDYLFKDEPTRNLVYRYHQTLDYTPFLQQMEMEPGLIEFLAFIRPQIKTAICTNRTTTIRPVLRIFSLDSYFDLVVSALDVRQPKPHPESVYKILSFFEVNPENCLYIGDSEVDARTAESAGVPLVAYKNPALPADLHVRGFSELKTYLENGHRERKTHGC